jgi:hypothetical protein
MPTFLLADQLEILVEELVAAIPEKRSVYEKLLPAAAELRESRRRHLTDAQIQAIATGFDRAVGQRAIFRTPAPCSDAPSPMSWREASLQSIASAHG